MTTGIVVDNKKMISLTKYQLRRNLFDLSISLIITLLINLIVSVIVSQTLKMTAGTAAVLDIIVYAQALIFGMVFSAKSIKFALINGISRHSFYFASLISIIVAALAWALLLYIFMLFGHFFARPFNVYTILYNDNMGGMLLYLFGMICLCMSLGYFIAMAVYRMKRRHIIITGLALVLLSAILIVINVFSHALLDAVSIAILFMGGLNLTGDAAVAAPYIAFGFMMLAAVLLAGASYLFVRKTQIRN